MSGRKPETRAEDVGDVRTSENNLEGESPPREPEVKDKKGHDVLGPEGGKNTTD